MSPSLLGSLCMLGAVAVFGANFPLSRHAALNGLTPWDIVFLRCLVAGVLLLPVVIARGWRDCAGIGWRRGFILFLLGGFPMNSIMLVGLSLAPAAHGASITPGTVTLIGAVGSWLLFGEKLGWRRAAGLLVVLAGLGLIAFSGAAADDPNVWRGDLLFILAGLVWGGYPLLLQRWSIDPLTSTAVVAVISLTYLPLYFLFADPQVDDVPLMVSVFHGVNQGIVNVIAGLWLWAKAITLMGAGKAGRFPPLIPVIGTLLAIPLLSEWPGPWQAAGIVAIVAGLLYVASVRNAAPR